MNKIQKIIGIITIVLFIIFITIPVITMNTKHSQVSEIDNTSLMEFKDIGTKQSIPKDFETYISERIGFRTNMINTYLFANDAFFNTLLHPTYEYGKNGYVFFKMSKEELDKNYLNSFARYIKYMQTYCTSHDISFLYCINPDKTQVYAQYLPCGANLTFCRQKYLLSKLQDYNINYLDNTPLLINESEKTQVFDKKYDAGHWNETGALIGMSNILNELKKTYPDLRLNEDSDYTAADIIHEYLPLSYFRIDEPSVTYTRNSPETIDITADDTDIELNDAYNDYSHYINPNHPDYPKILVFRGSYFLGKEKFMNESFSESIFVHSYYNIFNMEYYIDRFDPDIVLFESVEYATINKYFPKKMLENKINSNTP